MPSRSEIDQQLAELYERIPPMKDCKGRCWISCSAIDMSDRERQRIRQAGYRISTPEEARENVRQHGAHWCEALTSEGLCAVYELRPAICRLWGTARGLRCHYGCEPEWWLDDMEVSRIHIMAGIIGGGHTEKDLKDFDRAMKNPQRRRLHLEMVMRDMMKEREMAYSRELPPIVKDRDVMRKAAAFVRPRGR